MRRKKPLPARISRTIFGTMSSTAAAPRVTPPLASLQAIVAPYERGATGPPVLLRRLGTAFALTWWLMLRSLSMSYWITIALAFPCAGFRDADVHRAARLRSRFVYQVCPTPSRHRPALLARDPRSIRIFRRFHGAHHATSASWMVAESISRRSPSANIWRCHGWGGFATASRGIHWCCSE